MAQGAKPGEGGQLPGHKVYPWIAKVRHSTPGVGLISPPPHHDIYSIEDLAELIHDLKNANHHARISVKLVAEVGVGTIAAGVAKAHADVVLISGHDGGTGASPLTSIKHAGAPWELGLAETQQTLVLNDLRSRIVVEVDGQLKTGRDVVIGALLGAEEFGFATAPLVALGCVMMRVCHLNTCPVGVATQDPELRKKFTGDPEHVVNFMRFIAEEVREIDGPARLPHLQRHGRPQRSAGDDARRSTTTRRSASISRRSSTSRTCRTSVGRYLHADAGSRPGEVARQHDAAASCASRPWSAASRCGRRCRSATSTAWSAPSSAARSRAATARTACPTTRSSCTSRARPGQSFGAFIPRGMTLILEGDANDYVGKGLSGGKIIVYPPTGSTFVPEENVIVGNVALYGAHGRRGLHSRHGRRALLRAQQRRQRGGRGGRRSRLRIHDRRPGGRARADRPELRRRHVGRHRLCPRRERRLSQATATRRWSSCSALDDPEEIAEVQSMIRRHAEYTSSDRAWKMLALWDEMVPKFVKVYPNDYRRVIETQKRYQGAGLAGRGGDHGGVRGERPRPGPGGREVTP